ncbi:MFS transporter [Annulohypoxylon truncatum]|uniref:MFS transporter n=1 Tax=Annulohypoxylon truncatum TaxID=327061 RepID=UPI002007A843|nr:MFS transporter [Annulohypoxylon truncatum]KAI1214962.1 MFS transporter [Annulohypoxylon truncatum]
MELKAQQPPSTPKLGDTSIINEKPLTAKQDSEPRSHMRTKLDPKERALVRKLDFYIMPTICVMYFLNYVDRNAIAQARLNHFERDLNMAGNEFNTAVSILFVGYVLVQVPSNMLITRVKPGIYMSGWMFLWAVVSACTAAVKSYRALVACRFFLGIAEAPVRDLFGIASRHNVANAIEFYPGATYILAIYYTHSEMAARVGLMYSGQLLATGFTGLISAGVFARMDGLRGLAGWQWLFIIEGAFTAFVAVLGFWLLPNMPNDTRWLSEEERKLVHARMERDRISDVLGEASTWEGLKQAFQDIRTWLFCLMQMFHLSACSFNAFFPTVTKTLGYNTTLTLLLTCPPFVLAAAGSTVVGWSSGRLNERAWHITATLSIAIIGFVIAASTLNMAARYVACFIFPLGAFSANSVIVGWASSTLSQTEEKRAVVLAITNVFGHIGYIYGAYLWPDSDEPRYGIGFGASAGFALLSIFCAWVVRMLLIQDNKKIRASNLGSVNLYSF